MNSELTSYPLGAFLLGVVGMAYWYYKMFHASGGWGFTTTRGEISAPQEL